MSILQHVPAPPDFRVDWNALDASYDWVRRMAGCRQDPEWHAEGDVWIHTRMVLEALVTLEGWRTAGDSERATTFLAALLHDVAKPDCTQTTPEGRITSRGHSRLGALRARRLLWEMGLPPGQREHVAALVARHQLPFFAADRDDAHRVIVKAGQCSNCRLLGLVAEADARGRRCSDPQRLLDNIELFRGLAAELGCLERPRPFESEHARVQYFRNDDRPLDAPAHDDTRTEVVLMSGLPAAGKDHFVDQSLDLPCVSLDDIRRELGISPTAKQGAVLQLARERAREYLRRGEPFVWNATNLTVDRRSSCIDLFTAYSARVRIAHVETDRATLYRRNESRNAPVPRNVLEKMIRQWSVPDPTEAHRVECYVDGARVEVAHWGQ